MCDPVLAEYFQRAGGQRHVAILGPLAAVDMDHHPAVDVADLQVQPFPKPQSQRVDRPEIGAVVERSDGGDELSHLVDGEHVGECLVPADVEALESGPVTRRGVAIEEPDAAASDDQRGRGELAVVLEVQQIVADLLLGEPFGWGCGSGRPVA